MCYSYVHSSIAAFDLHIFDPHFFALPERLVIIPTYNEKENIRTALEAVMANQPEFHVLVVDDGSPDGTAQLVNEVSAAFPERIHLLERKEKSGLGTAYIAGFKWGLAHNYEYIFEMDADMSHDPKDLVRLYKACAEDGYDVSIGSRYTKGGSVKDWPWNRILLSYFASVYVRMVLWLGVKDTTAGFKCYKRKVLEAIDLDNIRFVGYAFQIEMKYKAKQKGFRLTEVPITFKDRTIGESKMSMNIFKEAIWGVLQMRFSKG